MESLPLRRTPAAASLALALFTLAGCTNPFVFEDEDYGRRAAIERLRDIKPMSIDEYKKPPRTFDSEAERRAAIDTARGRFEKLGKAELTIEQCRASALEHNLDLKVALLSPTIAAQSVSEEEGRFEGAFTTRALWSESDAATASTLVSGESKFAQIEPGVRIPTRTGETISVSLPFSRSETDNQFATLNPSYSADLEFSISQPLLRGGGRRAATAPLRIAGYNAQASEASTKLEAIRQLTAVDRSYWQLYGARRALEVAQQQYELADAQLKRAERRVNAGQSPEIEVTRAQSGSASRLEGIIRAQNAVLLRQRELKRIVNLPELPVESETVVVPQSQPDPVEYVIDRPATISLAMNNRMELLELELRAASDLAQSDLARNRALPLFTLDYVYRINGLGASEGRAFDSLADNRFEDWSIGLNAEVPLGNEVAMSQVRRAVLQRMQRLGTKSARELAIRQEVLNSIDDIELGWQRILAARQSVILNTRTLQAEQRQFEVGTRTSTDVLEAAASLAEAQLTEINALVDYQIAQVDLAFSTGMVLGATKVRWTPADAPDESITTSELFRLDRWNEGEMPDELPEHLTRPADGSAPATKPDQPAPETAPAPPPAEQPK